MSSEVVSTESADPHRSQVDEEGFEALHPNAIWGHRLGFFLGFGVLAVGPFIGLNVVLEVMDFHAATGGRIVLALVLLALVARLAWRLGERGFRAVRYRLDEEGVEIHRGIWWRSELRVLRSRVQHTDLQRGPLDRRLGLADLELHTAGSKNATVKLEGLDVERAVALRDALLQGHDRQF